MMMMVEGSADERTEAPSRGEVGAYGGIVTRWKLAVAPLGNFFLTAAAVALGASLGVLIRDAGAGWLRVVSWGTIAGSACVLAGGMMRMLERIAWPQLWEKRREKLYSVLLEHPANFTRSFLSLAVFAAMSGVPLVTGWLLGYGWEIAAGWACGASAAYIAVRSGRPPD